MIPTDKPPSLSLYRLSGDFLDLVELRRQVAGDPDAQPSEIAEALAAIDDRLREYAREKIPAKTDNIAGRLRECLARYEFLKAEAQRCMLAAKSWMAEHDWLERLVMGVMGMLETKRLQGQHSLLRLQANPASVDVRQPELLPNQFQRVSVTMPMDLFERVHDLLAKREDCRPTLMELLACPRSTPEPTLSAIGDALKCPACRAKSDARKKCEECKGTGLSKEGVAGASLVLDAEHLRVENA